LVESLERLNHGGLKRTRGVGVSSGKEGAPSLGTLKDMLGKSSDTVISLHRSHLTTEWHLESGVWGSYTGDFEG